MRHAAVAAAGTSGRTATRRGTILVLAAAVMVIVLGLVAFSVDVGYVTFAKAQMQSAADAAALAAANELAINADKPAAVRRLSAASAAVDVARLNYVAGSNAFLDPQGDVRVGSRHWNAVDGNWQTAWESEPFNTVQVWIRRGGAAQAAAGGGPGPLPLFFAPVIGHEKINLSQTATAAVLPGVGFRLVPGRRTVPVLPIALDLASWDALLQGSGTDDYAYDPSTGHVSRGRDGKLELNLYPGRDKSLPSGNRGTVDIGGSNNSTADLVRQILYGPNDADLAYFGGELRTDNGPLNLNGDPGLSAGIKGALAAIIGQTRAIPIFSHVAGNGNNATYTIVKFVGIRIMDVQLTGNPKYVIIQPASFSDPTVIAGQSTATDSTIFTTPKLVD